MKPLGQGQSSGILADPPRQSYGSLVQSHWCRKATGNV
jgi:hypothetical protein